MSRQQITDMQSAYRAEKGISLPAVDKAATILRTLRFIVLFFFPFILLRRLQRRREGGISTSGR